MNVREALPYRLGVGIMLLNQDNQVFVAKRIDTRAEAWQMPQGGIDDGELPETAAFRELKEETGMSHARILAQSQNWHRYNLPDELIGTIWDGRYCGQEQKWFAMRFTGCDSDIDIATEEPEFSEWKWVEMAQLPDLIVPFKRDLYSALVQEFSHLI